MMSEIASKDNYPLEVYIDFYLISACRVVDFVE